MSTVTYKLWPVLTVLAVLVAGAATIERYAERRAPRELYVSIRGGAPAVLKDDETGEEDDAAPDDTAPVSSEHAAARRAARRGELDTGLAAFASEVEARPELGRLRAEYGYWLLVARQPERAREQLERAAALESAEPRIVLNLGVARRRTGDLDAAEAAFRRALDLRPTYGAAQVALGSLLRRRGNLDEAIMVLAVAAGNGGNEERARASVALGRAYLASGRRGEAARAFDDAINWAPAQAEVRINIARAYLVDGTGRDDVERAVEILQRVVELAPDLAQTHSILGRALERAGRPAAAETAYERALRLEPGYLYVMRKLLRLALEQRNFARARLHAERLTLVAPEEPEHHFLAGLVAARSGRTGEARAHYQRAIAQAGGDYPEAWLNLGWVEKKAGNADAAIAAYRRAVELRPDYTAALNNLGLTHAAAGDGDAAEAAYRRAVAIDRRYGPAWLNLGKLLRKRGDHDAAIAALQRAVAEQPDYDEAWLSLGVTYARAERYDDAIAVYRHLIAMQPRYVSAWYNLGLALEDAGRLGEAAGAFLQARTLDPNHTPSLRKLARVYRKDGRLAEARALLTELVDRQPNDNQVRLELADLLRRAGGLSECARHARLAFAEDPDSERAARLLKKCAPPDGYAVAPLR